MKLDLHGIKHEDVQSLVDSHIYKHGPPCEIVTGNSVKMKQIVVKVIKEHDLSYFNLGTGALVVIEKPI
jgi:hypothetical protein